MTLKHIFPNHFLRRVVHMAGGTFVAQAIGLAALPFLTRYYSPEAFGFLGTFIALMAWPAMAASGRYEQGLPLPEEEQKARDLLAVCLSLAAITTLLLTVVTFMFGSRLVLLMNASILTYYLPLLPIGFALMSLFQILSWWATRRKNFVILGQTRILQSTIAVAIQLVLATHSAFVVGGLIIGHVIGLFAGITLIFRLLGPERGNLMPSFSLQTLKQNAARWRRFPLFNMPASLVMLGVSSHLPVLLFTAFYGIEAGGLVFLAQKALGIPSQLVGQAVAQVMVGELGGMNRGNHTHTQQLVKKITLRMGLLGLVGFGTAALVLPHIAEPVLGPQWHDTGPLFAPFCLLFFMQFTALPALQMLTIKEQQAQNLSFALFRLTALAAIPLGAMYGLDMLTAVLIHAALQAVIIGMKTTQVVREL